MGTGGFRENVLKETLLWTFKEGVLYLEHLQETLQIWICLFQYKGLCHKKKTCKFGFSLGQLQERCQIIVLLFPHFKFGIYLYQLQMHLPSSPLFYLKERKGISLYGMQTQPSNAMWDLTILLEENPYANYSHWELSWTNKASVEDALKVIAKL